MAKNLMGCGALLALLASSVVVARAQSVPGAVFRVNTFTAGTQEDATVGMDAAGNFVIAWTSFGQDGSGSGIFAQRYDSAGTRQGPELEDDDDGRRQRRTYTVVDLAGNTLLVVEAVKREGHEIKARIESLQYNGAAVIPAARNRTSFEWSAAKDGMVKELEQKMEVRRGRERQEIEAKFKSKENETALRLHAPHPDRKLVRPGLLLLRMATDRGLLTIEFDPWT